MGKLIIAGDLFPTGSNVAYFMMGNIQSLFGDKICQLFADADLAVCNLEGSLTDSDSRCQKTGPVKVAPEKAIAAYKALGVKCCLLANNHSTDGGRQGLLDTIHVLDDSGIDHIGAGENSNSIRRSAVYEIDGMRVGLYNVSETMYNKPGEDRPGAWLYDEFIVCKEIEQARRECDYLIVVYHGGIEKFPYPSPELKKRFHRMADSGADAVISQHTHCIGSEEFYHGSWLLYGQGDFLLKNFKPGCTDTGLLLEFDIREGSVTIEKHLVRSVDDMFVRYDDKQDLSAFKLRSEKLGDEEFVSNQLQSFCDNELRLYLTAFKSPSKARRLQRRFFPGAYRKWLYTYSSSDLMFALHTLRSEQNRETAIIGLEHMLAKEKIEV